MIKKMIAACLNFLKELFKKDNYEDKSTKENSNLYCLTVVSSGELKKMHEDFYGEDSEARKQQTANMLSFSRIITSLIGSIGIIVNTSASLLITTIFLALGFTTDIFDGRTARRWGNSSNTELKNGIVSYLFGVNSYGAMLDIMSDKISSALIGAALLITNPWFIIPLIGEAGISAINLKYKSENKEIELVTTMAGKIKEFFLKPLFILGVIAALLNCLSLEPNATEELIKIANGINTAVYCTMGLNALAQAMTAISYVKQGRKRIEELKKEKSLAQSCENVKEREQPNKPIALKLGYDPVYEKSIAILNATTQKSTSKLKPLPYSYNRINYIERIELTNNAERAYRRQINEKEPPLPESRKIRALTRNRY